MTRNVTDSKFMVAALQTGGLDILPAVSLVDVINESSKKPLKPLIFSNSRMRNNPHFEALTVLQNSTINTLKDFKSEENWVCPGITSLKAVEYFLKENKVNISKIKFVPLAPPDHLKMLQLGEIDCSHIYAPEKEANEFGNRVREIYRLEIYAYFNEPSAIGVSIMSQKFYQDRPNVASNFLKAWDEAVLFIRDNDFEARNILKKKLLLSDEVAQTATWVNIYF